MLQYYGIGILSLVVFCLLSRLTIKNWNPFAMAKDGNNGSGKGGNKNYSASLLQMIVFSMLTVFAYTTVFAARFFEPGGALIPTSKDWLQVPGNLLILMGISVGTAVASRAIRSQENTDLPAVRVNDNSSLTTDVNGRTDLVKIQMMIWTVIAVVVYLAILSRFMMKGCYLTSPDAALCGTVGNTLPDIDSTFMVLLGVSQGGYVVNKLSESSPDNTESKPIVDSVQPDKPEAKELSSTSQTQLSPAQENQLPIGEKPAEVSVITTISIEPATAYLTIDAPNQPLTATAKDAQGNPVTNAGFNWISDNIAVAAVDNNGSVTRVAAGNCSITATANAGAVVSNKCEVTCA